VYCAPEVTALYAALGDGDDVFYDRTNLVATIRGDDGNDLIHRWFGYTPAGSVDDLRGGPGDDAVWAGAGDARLYGENGSDRLHGGAGDDQLAGGSGADFLDGGDGADLLSGGADADVVTYASHPAGVSAGLDGSPGNDGTPGEHDTVAASVFSHAADDPDHVVIQRLVDGSWTDVTCAQVADQVRSTARGLIAISGGR